MDQENIDDCYFEEKAVIEEDFDISLSKGKDYFIGLIENIMMAISKIEKTESAY